MLRMTYLDEVPFAHEAVEDTHRIMAELAVPTRCEPRISLTHGSVDPAAGCISVLAQALVSHKSTETVLGAKPVSVLFAVTTAESGAAISA